MFNLLIGYRYRSAAVLPDDPTEAELNSLALVDELRGQPGTRVPHAWVQRDDVRISTLDLIGTHFTVLTGDDGAPWCASAASVSAALGVPLSAHRIGVEGDIVDVDGQWAANTGLSPQGALLIRPDGVVAWRADALPPDPDDVLRRALTAILGRTAIL